MINFFILILIIATVFDIWFTSILYVRKKKKDMEIIFPIWFNTYFRLLITEETTSFEVRTIKI